MTYYDTGVLVKLYVPEQNSLAVQRFVAERGMAIAVNDLQDGEARNAFSLKAFRQEISSTELADLRAKWERDFTGARLLRRSVPWPDVFQRSAELTARHTTEIGCRTLDILHVAVALILQASEFVTLDKRQRKLAVAAGLSTVSPISHAG